MFYKKYCSIDLINGTGLNSSLLLTNEKQNLGYFTNEILINRIISDLNEKKINRTGILIAGNDPLNKENLNNLSQLILRILHNCPTKKIWIWTNYNRKKLSFEQREIANLAHILIDSSSHSKFYDPNCAWKKCIN